MPTCNTTGDLAAQPACVTDAAGIFVSPSGNDLTGSGTKESPFKTIGKALGARSAAQSNVFVCAGSYDEHVVVASAVGLYGGFACLDWSHSTSANTVMIAPTTAGYALSLQAVGSATVEDLQLDAIAGSAAGETSVAVFAATSTATFRRVAISAGNAGPAPAAGTAGTNYPAGSPQAAPGGTGLASNSCTACTDGQYSITGAAGGIGPGAGGPGSSNPTFTGESAGIGGTASTCAGGGVGGDGSGTPDGTGGAAETTYGTLSMTGWAATSGSQGGTAGAAQGGGGGAGGATSGLGGGGGCGGCGGGGGARGTGGGSSFGVLSYQSTLTFDTCNISTGTPSNGGAGGDGQAGQTGGDHGNASGSGCQGGQGGTGGNGGGGSGGAAGASVGIGYVGTSPTLMTTTPTVSGTVATGGAAGAHGTPAASKGKDGTNAPTLAL